MRRRDVMGTLGVLGAAPFAPVFAEHALGPHPEDPRVPVETYEHRVLHLKIRTDAGVEGLYGLIDPEAPRRGRPIAHDVAAGGVPPPLQAPQVPLREGPVGARQWSDRTPDKTWVGTDRE